MKPDRRQNYVTKIVPILQDGVLFFVAENHNNKGDYRTKHDNESKQITVRNH